MPWIKNVLEACFNWGIIPCECHNLIYAISVKDTTIFTIAKWSKSLLNEQCASLENYLIHSKGSLHLTGVNIQQHLFSSIYRVSKEDCAFSKKLLSFIMGLENNFFGKGTIFFNMLSYIWVFIQIIIELGILTKSTVPQLTCLYNLIFLYHDTVTQLG